MHKLFHLTRFVFFSLVLNPFYAFHANAVPTSFLKSSSGNMHDVNWYLLESQNVQIYYDQNAYGMGRYALTSVQEAYPYLSALLGVRIGKNTNTLFPNENYLISKYPKIVLVLGNRIEGPGFANPVTENIEAQMIHPRRASFFQHELVHRLMYEHNDLHLGAPGRVFSLAMMPTWWIEGLAEYLTESVGRVETDGMARSMALNNGWPTWERLHSLYNADSDTNSRGYVTSGRFLEWIFSQTKEKNLFNIFEELTSKTATPFFYSASDNWLKQNLNQTGPELYIKFKGVQKKTWETYLSSMPKLTDAKIGEPLFNEEYTYKIYTDKVSTLIPKLTTIKSAQQSAFIVNTNPGKSSQLIRKPLSLYGTPLVAIQGHKDSLFATVKFVEFSNSSYGNDITIVKFKGNIFNLEDGNITNLTTIKFSSIDKPLVVEEIQNAGDGGFFIHASLRGKSLIYFLDTHGYSVRKIAEYEFPIYPKFIGINKATKNNNLPCVMVILNWDKEQTSVENICSNLTHREIISKNQLNIQDGVVLNNGTLRLVVSWDRLLSLVDIINRRVQPIAAFPEWMQEISDWGDGGHTFTGWIYENGKYKLYKFDIRKLKDNFTQWQTRTNKNPIFSRFPQSKPYTPPFKKIYSAFISSRHSSTLSRETVRGATTGPSKIRMNPPVSSMSLPPDDSISGSTTLNDTAINKKVSNHPAAYDRSFLFAFPYALPDILGGPSINLVAMPYQDKMERDQLQIFGGYNFYLKAPSGTVSYINNRLLDGFVASLFAAPFFNGTYDKNEQGKNSKYYNYLLQEGISLANLIKFMPTTFELQQIVSLTHIEPYSHLDTAPTYVGAQNTTLFSLTENLSFNLFNKGLYLSQKNDPFGRYAIWKTNLSLGGTKSTSLNGSTDSQNNPTGDLDYYNLNAAFVSSVSFHKQLVSLTGRLSTTQGSGTFNLKEYSSPYQNYILGNTTSLNYISYPILTTESLFNLKMGYWSGQTSLNYEFPLAQDFESLFLMSYINDWRGIFSLSESGVSQNTNGTNFSQLTTLSLGTTLNMDIKGFQIYPSLFYSQLIEEGGWGIIMQVKLMDFL